VLYDARPEQPACDPREVLSAAGRDETGRHHGKRLAGRVGSNPGGDATLQALA
jgi:hypothetical protein